MDDVEMLRKLILLGKTELEIGRMMGWSHHRIKRIRERAKKDDRPVPSAGEEE
jgi:hypothetical protein